MCVCTCKPAYSSSLTDAEWALIEPLLPVHDPHAGGRPLKHDRRLVLDSILYVLVSGCAWRTATARPGALGRGLPLVS